MNRTRASVFMKRIFVALGAGVIGGLWGSACAQTPDVRELERNFVVYRDAAVRTWQRRLLPEFMRVADDKTKALLEDVSFRVVRFSDFNAFSNYANKRITLPVGLLIIMDVLADGMMLTTQHPECRPQLEQLVRDVGDTYIQAVRGEGRRLPDFLDTCRISVDEALRLRTDHDLYGLKATILVDSLALVVGHEIGHLVKHHGAYSEVSIQESQRQEYESDAFGFDLATRGDFVPMLGIATVFTVFGTIESATSQRGKASHPPVACRVHRLLELVMQDSRLDWKIVERQPGGTTRESFKKLSDELRDDCESNQKEGSP